MSNLDDDAKILAAAQLLVIPSFDPLRQVAEGLAYSGALANWHHHGSEHSAKHNCCIPPMSLYLRIRDLKV